MEGIHKEILTQLCDLRPLLCQNLNFLICKMDLKFLEDP